MRRVVTPELLDSDRLTPQEISDSLADLRLVNQRFGGVSTTVAMVRRAAGVVGRDRVSLLDVGAGSGDIALAVQRAMARKNVRVDLTLSDRKLTHLQLVSPAEAYPEEHPQIIRNDTCEYRWPPRRVVADALALPFADSAFDIVACALLAHHLEPDQLRTFVREALRVCRVAVLINDLRRSRLSLGLVYAGSTAFRSPISRHDGLASVRRAYTIAELRHMLNQDCCGRIEIFPHYLYRMAVTIWKGR